jgi:hypothetical protein
MAVRASNDALDGVRPGLRSLGALVLSAVGVVGATWLIVGSDGDPSQVLWPAVVAPLAICLTPVLLPRQAVRIGAVFAHGGWCVLAVLSIGFTQWPALIASLLAVSREGP